MKTLILPEWYGDKIIDLPKSQRGRNPLSVRKALAGIAETLATELSGANQVQSWLSNFEPRAKILGILVLIFGVTCLSKLLPLLIAFSLTSLLAASIRLPFKRLSCLWLGVPLFSLAIILPATLNIVTPGHTTFFLCHFGEGARLGQWNLPVSLTVTHEGLIVAARFMLRSISCVTLTALLISSTNSSTLVNALRRLGMPRIFGMTLAVMQRYLSLLLRAAEEIHLAKLSRTIAVKSIRNEQRWIAAGIGVLFARTHRLAEEIRLAMVSRGYDGDLQVRSIPSLQARDFVWLSGVTLVMSAMLLIDHL